MDNDKTLKKFRGLAVEGGGTAAISYSGAIQEFIDQGYSFSQFTHFAGSSAGSFLAGMLAVRASVDYMVDVLENTDFKKFKDDSWGVVRDLYRLYEHYGWYRGDALQEWYADAMEHVTGNRDITFKEIHQRYGTHLIITKVDLLYPRCVLVPMDYLSHPDTKLHEAVRASASIPFYFTAVEGGDEAVNGIEGAEKGHLFVDGGTLNNYPLELLYKYLPQEEVMGYYLVAPREVNAMCGEKYRPIKNFQEGIKSLIKTLRDAALKAHIHPDDIERTVIINVGHISSTDFTLTEEDKEFLILRGREGMVKFIDKWES